MSEHKRTTFADANDPATPTERREWSYHSRTVEPPSSVVWWIDCPFCQGLVKAYLWSLAGGGKRCTCGALFGMSGCYRRT